MYRKGWGSLARKGAARIAPLEGVGDSASAEWRKAVQEARDKDLGRDFSPEEWVRVDDVRDEASGAVERGRQKSQKKDGTQKTSSRSDRTVPGTPIADQRDELGKAVGARQAEKLAKVVRDAARAFDRERYGDSRKLLAPVTERVPTFAPARELLGVTYYRMGRWKQAVRELEAFRDLTGSTEQHPVLADCYRALGKWKQVDELWLELREASPSAELVTEGRIVTAGALADQGKLRPAISLLGEKGWKLPKVAKEHHLRRAYALADLYERAGDVAHARDLFGRIVAADPDFGDVSERLRALN
ncbi:MAG: tetratricopeptide repeat protein [Acidimicrobiales bacterium]|nr:tetratricopeptide repeat protein [Acidimicrobiales bacterium]